MEGLNETASAGNEGCTRGDVPFIFWSERKRYVGKAGRDTRQFIGHRAHWLNLERRVFKLFPLSTFGFAAAGENQRPLQFLSLAGRSRRTVVCDPAVNCAQKDLVGCGIAYTPGHRLPVLNHRNRNAEFGDSLNELPRPIEGIDNPDALVVKTRKIIGTFLGKPSLALSQQVLSKYGINGAVRLGHRIMSGFILGCDFSRRESGKDFPGCFNSSFYPLQHPGIRTLRHFD